MTTPASSYCYACNRPAKQIKERADLGVAADRVTVCDCPDCQPEQDGSKWHTFNLDGTVPPAPEPKGPAK